MSFAAFLTPSMTCIADHQHRRKDFGDKAQEKLTPDSQKSLADQASESASSAYDKAASYVQPGMLLLSQVLLLRKMWRLILRLVKLLLLL